MSESQENSPSETPQQNNPFKISPELFQTRGRIFSVMNQKGGCGKTTTTVNLSAALAKLGFQVLAIDLDPQMNASLGLGIRPEEGAKTIYDLFKNPNLSPFDAVQSTSVENFHIIAGSRGLSSLAVEIMDQPGWESQFKNFARSLKQFYHFIFIDCPPALNALTVNSLAASDDIVIPFQTHYFAMEGMKELFITVDSVREKYNPGLRGGNILPTMFDKRPKLTREILESIRGYFKERVFDTVIRNNVKLMESSMHGYPVLVYDPASNGAKDYQALAEELLRRETPQSQQEKIQSAVQVPT